MVDGTVGSEKFSLQKVRGSASAIRHKEVLSRLFWLTGAVSSVGVGKHSVDRTKRNLTEANLKTRR
jgi:hypothetical protein